MPHVDLGPTRRALVAQGSALALLGSTAPVAAIPHSDAELLRLGHLMDVAWVEERAAFAERILPEEEAQVLMTRLKSIVGQIELLPATTLDGVIVKARACAWCHDGEPFDEDSFGSGTTDVRLVSSILRDLIAISGKPVFTS